MRSSSMTAAGRTGSMGSTPRPSGPTTWHARRPSGPHGGRSSRASARELPTRTRTAVGTMKSRAAMIDPRPTSRVEVPTPLRRSRCFPEVTQIGRRLILAGGHQQTLRAEIEVVVTDTNVRVVLGAGELQPKRPLLLDAAVVPDDRPRASQGVVGHRNFIMQDVGVRLVEIDTLLEYRLISGVH